MLGVLADTAEERRLALVQPLHAHHLEIGVGGHTALLDRPAVVVRERQLDPSVVGPKAGRPEDGRDSSILQIELRSVGDLRRLVRRLGLRASMPCA